MELKPWIKCVRLHSDVESETTAIATFAIDLGALVKEDPNIPSVYRDAYSFFRITHFTSGLRRLLKDVLERLSGKEGDRVLQLRSPFGGGKSHTLASLFYAVKEREVFIKAFPEAETFPDPGKVNIAVFDGEKFDCLEGVTIDGEKIKTLWGWLAYQLGKYDLVKEHDQKRLAPGGELIQKMLEDSPNLILLDEVLKYVERGLAEKIGDSNLGRLTLEFIHTLSSEVANSKKSCLVYSLQASARESYGNVELLSILDHITSRVDAKREPVTGDEVFFVLRKRFFEEVDTKMAEEVSEVYIQAIRKTMLSYAQTKEERLKIEDEILKLKERFKLAYPFHPALIDVMREKWASIPDFQKTRGILRFLTVVLRTLKKRNVNSLLISSGDVPLDDPDTRNAFFTEVGQREQYHAVLEADFIGPNARIVSIDRSLVKENPNLSGINPAMQVGITILLNSFGGQLQRETQEGEIYYPGMTETEIIQALVSPSLDGITIGKILKELRDRCFYIHYDGARYSFKTVINLNKRIEDETQNVSADEIESFLKNELERELAGKNAIVWPKDNRSIPDEEPTFLLVYLSLDSVYMSDLDKKALNFLTYYGERQRKYRNSLGLAMPLKSQIEPLKRTIKYLIAIDRIKSRRRQLNLTERQIEELKERERTEKSSFESSFKNLYASVWLVKADNGKLTLEKLEIGGRPIQAQNIHERLIEFLTRIQRKIFDTIRPRKIIELMRLGEEGKMWLSTQEIKDAFFSYIGFPRLIDEVVIRKAICEGIQEGLFGYVGNKNKINFVEGKIEVPKQWLRYKERVFDDEIDLSSGLIVLPEVLPVEVESQPVGPIRPTPQPGPGGEEGGREGPSPVPKITKIKWKLRVDRAKLFKIFNALGNLAEKCQEMNLTIEAEPKEEINPNWLRNAVREPIEESDVDIEEIQ